MGDGGIGKDEVWGRECSHNLQSGQLSWWLADNCIYFSQSNVLEAKSEPIEKKFNIKLKK